MYFYISFKETLYTIRPNPKNMRVFLRGVIFKTFNLELSFSKIKFFKKPLPFTWKWVKFSDNATITVTRLIWLKIIKHLKS